MQACAVARAVQAASSINGAATAPAAAAPVTVHRN
jgi:hypothetical protein